jgi:hypothetical protein
VGIVRECIECGVLAVRLGVTTAALDAVIAELGIRTVRAPQAVFVQNRQISLAMGRTQFS